MVKNLKIQNTKKKLKIKIKFLIEFFLFHIDSLIIYVWFTIKNLSKKKKKTKEHFHP